MTTTTFATFFENLGEINVSSVTTQYSKAPVSIDTGHLPASFPRLPEGDEAPLTFSGQGGWPELRAEFVVVVNPVAQDTQGANIEDVILMLDDVHNALKGLANGTLGRGKIDFILRVSGDFVIGNTLYWAVIAGITAYGE